MAIRGGLMIPGLGVNYTSPANTPRSNAINIRSTGASSSEANRFANLAPAGTTTRPPSQPASANSALGLGSQTRPQVPPSLSSTRAPAPQPTLIPSALDFAGRSGGGVSTTPTGAVRSSGSGVNTNTLQGVLDASGPDFSLGGGSSSSGAGGGGTGGGGTGGGGTGGGGTGGGSTTPDPAEAPATEADSGGTSAIDAAAALDAAIAQLLDPEFIAFQGDRASELRRLQNLRNQLFGDAEFGQTGSVQRQEELDANARRRLAAQRAMSGMLQGGAYAGTERGLGTMQRANQDFAMQEMQRPFREATAADRLREFGLEFDPTSRVFDQMDLDVTGFTTQTQAGREAAARARLAAIQQLAQQGITI